MEKLYPFKGWENKYCITRTGKVWGLHSRKFISVRQPKSKATLPSVVLHDGNRSEGFNVNKAIWVNFPDLLPEGFVPLPDFEGYAISRKGEVLSYRTNRILVADTTKTCPYLYVSLKKDGKIKHFSIHRLVAQTFVPNPDNLPEVDHIDRNPLNNRVENLRWVTRSGNLENTENGFRRNLRGCKLYYQKEFVKAFDCVAAAAKYAVERFGASLSSMRKFYKSRGCELVMCND